MDPKFKLRVWLYASLRGMHAASQVVEALKTDAALELAADGHTLGESSLMPAQRETHVGKVAKHAAAVARCTAEGRTSFSTTWKEASLMKFPSGGSKLGHRIITGRSTVCRWSSSLTRSPLNPRRGALHC